MFRSCASSLFSSFSESKLDKTEIKSKKENAYKEYSKLFCPDVLRKIEFSSFDVSKSKHPLWSFTYDREYEVYVYKLSLSNDSSLKTLLKIHKDKVNHFDVNYRGSELDEVSFIYNDLHDSLIKNLNLTYEGELTDSLSFKGSLIFLDINCEKLGFNYEKNTPADILFQVKKLHYKEINPPRSRFNISIFKNKQSMFIIVLRPRTRSRQFEKLFLLNLLDDRIYNDTINNSN